MSTLQECRAAGGTGRGQAETCSGTDYACPSDGNLPVGTLCRSANGAPCANDMNCTGSNACPTTTYKVGVQCRGAQGVCEKPALCVNGNPNCPSNPLWQAGDNQVGRAPVLFKCGVV
jgi:hypothetical protein